MAVHDNPAGDPGAGDPGADAPAVAAQAPSPAALLAELLAERDIHRGLARFAEVLDSRAWHRLGEVFTPDALVVYSEYRAQGLEAIERHFRQFLGGCGPSQHLLGNIVIEVEGEVAHSRASVCASHLGAAPGDTREFIAFGGYRARWSRLAIGWRIAHWEWQHGWFRGDYGILQPG